MTLAADEMHEVALERCDCGQYSLSVGPVTVQLEEHVVMALQRVLNEALVSEMSDLDGVNMPLPSDVQ
jgi:hypothetical protein